MAPSSTVRVAVTSPPKPLAVPVRVSALAAVEEEELPPQAARVAAHSAPHRAMERMRFIMFEPRFCRTMPPGLPGRAWGAPESPVQTHL